MQGLLVSVVWVLTFYLPAARSVDVQCGEPPAIPFSTVPTQEEYSLGSTVTYACQFGYTAKGRNRTLKCELSPSENEASWTQPQFVCTPQSCGDPGFIYNGRRIGSLFTFPNFVQYECNQGYRLVGLTTRYCQTSGSWSGRVPECKEVTCGPPQRPDNGAVTFTSLTYGSELKYECNKGFHLSTHEGVFCTTEGKWSNTNVQCIESICDMPLKPEHGSVLITGPENHPRAGSLAIFSCEGDRMADGPTASKCLDTGDWTYPPPNCLEPCSIPHITDGVIKKYVREGYRRRRVLKQISIGTKIEDNEEFYLVCDEGYEPLGSDKKEELITCSRGKWSRELECQPASCRFLPPSAMNAEAVVLNPEHGGNVLYLCNEDFKKIKNETVVCDFGTWKGSAPVCKSTRCFVDELVFPGLVKEKKSFYKDGEVFDIICDSRYQIASGKNPQLTCEDGIWRGPLPPCVAASCTQPPPQTERARAEVRSLLHSSIVKYICEDPYIPVGKSQVQCLFGKWEGQPPKCEDSRCYLENLQKSAYIDHSLTPLFAPSGYELYVTCKEGYSATSDRPLCVNGTWTRNFVTPCKESDCTVPLIYNGDMKEEKLGDYYWSWTKFRYDREVLHVKIPAGTVVPYGTSLNLICNARYSFQGTSVGRKGITCFKGKWQPDPVCLRVGQKYVPRSSTRESTSSIVTSPVKTESVSQKATTAVPRRIATNVPTTETSEVVTSATEGIPDFETNPSEMKCQCEYPINDDNLVAYSDGRRLKYHDKVKNGSSVIFRCEHVGFHRLRGVQEIKCDDCQSWHSSMFPICVEPERGSAVILFDNTLNISEEGNLEANKGQTVKLMCVAMESRMYPHWDIPSKDGVTITRERRERDSYGDVLYVSHLVMYNTDMVNEGEYGCAVGNNSMNIVNLLINDPDIFCPEFPEEDGISVSYDNERHMRSKASFSCTKPNQELTGKDILTCLPTGAWSDSFPQCKDKKCKELSGNDLLSIYYTNDRKVSSQATFHCFAPGERSGASFADCLADGTWSNPKPTCKTPPCHLDELISALPENVNPDVDNKNRTFPYNANVKLTCIEEFIVEGNSIAKCNRKGKWEFENIQCIAGCPPPTKPPESKLIIKPKKDIYKLGEMITFLCPPGMKLNAGSQLIMCLKYGWSETILPECE